MTLSSKPRDPIGGHKSSMTSKDLSETLGGDIRDKGKCRPGTRLRGVFRIASPPCWLTSSLSSLTQNKDQRRPTSHWTLC